MTQAAQWPRKACLERSGRCSCGAALDLDPHRQGQPRGSAALQKLRHARCGAVRCCAVLCGVGGGWLEGSSLLGKLLEGAAPAAPLLILILTAKRSRAALHLRGQDPRAQ